MKYTIEHVSFLDQKAVQKLLGFKEMVENKILAKSGWEFLRIPCIFSKDTFKSFSKEAFARNIISIFPSQQKKMQYFLNSPYLVGSFFEFWEGVVLSYRQIPQKYIIDSVLTYYDPRAKTFVSDYNNLIFVVVSDKNDTASRNLARKQINQCLDSTTINNSDRMLTRVFDLSKVVRCRDKNNSFINLSATFYIVTEDTIDVGNK